MAALMVKPPPLGPTAIIKEGATETLPDYAARRLVTQWLDALGDQAKAVDAAFASENKKFNLAETSGNPKGQSKFAKKVEASFGDNLLASGYQTGTRCRYSLTWFYLSVERLSRNVFTNGEWAPPTQSTLPWLTVFRTTISRNGVRALPDLKENIVMVFSHHAMQRIIQRGYIHTLPELLSALRRSWPFLYTVDLSTKCEMSDNDNFFIPVRIREDADPIVLVFRPTAFTSGGDTTSVESVVLGAVTALKLDQVPHDMRDAVRMLDAFSRQPYEGDFEVLRETFGRLIVACRKTV